MINEERARVTERGLGPCINDVCSNFRKGKSPIPEKVKLKHEVDNVSVPKCDDG